MDKIVNALGDHFRDEYKLNVFIWISVHTGNKHHNNLRILIHMISATTETIIISSVYSSL